MPNSYATVPNILPGNVTIGGNLTVGGDQIRIGVAAPYCRVGKRGGTIAAISHNYDLISGITDTVAFNLYLDMVAAAGNPLSGRWHDGVGGQNFYALGMKLAQSAVTVNVTGTTAETDLFRQTIRGGFMEANGALRLWIQVTGAAQGGVASTFRLKFGATTLVTFTKTVTQNIQQDLWLGNANSASLQNGIYMRYAGAAVEADGSVTSAVNTGANTDVALTIQPGAVGDSWTRVGVSLEPVVTST